MKYIKLSIGILGILMVMVSCKKEELSPVPMTTASNSDAFLKIVYASAYTVNYKVILKTNDKKVSNTITYSTPFPGGGLNTGGGNYPDYMSQAPGKTSISVVIPKSLLPDDSLLLSKNEVNLEAGKYYTVYLSDTSSKTKAFTVEENKEFITGDISRFRFVNTIPNSTGIDLYFGAEKVASNIKYNQSSPEFTLPRGQVERWYMRPAGADPASAAIATYPTGSTFMTIPNARIMSVYARGFLGSTGTLAPAVSLLYN